MQGLILLNLNQINGVAPSVTNPLPVEISDGSNMLGTTAHPVQVADQANGPVTPGTAAVKSELQGGVVATSAASGTVGQQMAVQMDSQGSVRVNPTGATSSFSSVNASAAGNAGAGTVLTVPAATKWIVISISATATVANSGSARTFVLLARDSGSNNLAEISTGSTIPAPISATTTYTCAPSLPFSSAIVGAVATMPFPELCLGPGMFIKGALASGVAGDTLALTANVVVLPD